MVELVRRSTDGAVAILTLARPPLNVINLGMLSELASHCDAIASDASVRCVIVTGGTDVFAAGADVSEFAAASAEEMRAMAPRVQQGLGAVASLPQPVIAAVAGYALGGGFELALACDLRVAADNAVFGLPEVLLGIIPGGGGTQRLARLVGTAKAKEIAWTGARFGAEEALAIGAVNEVVPAAELAARSLALARTISERPQLAVRAIKRAVDASESGTPQDGLAAEAYEFGEVFGAADAREGISAFLEKRPPEFRHS